MKKRQFSRRSTAALSIAVGLVAASHARAQDTPREGWSSGFGSYMVPSNWTHGVVPTLAANEFLTMDGSFGPIVSAGDNAEGAILIVGLHTGDSGSIEVTGGTLTAGELRIGGRDVVPLNYADWSQGTEPNAGGFGTFTQSGGTVSVTAITSPAIQNLYVANGGLVDNNTAFATYNLQGGVLTVGVTSANGIIIGSGADTDGDFVQTNGSVTSTGFISVGRRGGNGSWSISTGVIDVGAGAAPQSNLVIGDGANAAANNVVPGTVGSFSHSGGDINVNNDLRVGTRGGTGTYTITGGTLDIVNQLTLGGNSGSAVPALQASVGTFNQNGGTTTATAVNVGQSGTGTLNLNGGTLSAPTFTVGATGVGTINKAAAGNVVVTNTNVGATGKIVLNQHGNQAWQTNAVTIANGGQVDVKDNKFITQSSIGSWDGTQYTGMQGLVQSGRGDGSWNGSGFVTSMTDATTSLLTTLAVSTGAELRGLGPTDTDTFAGRTINGDSTIIMYTWGGDADMNGELNGDDYFFIDSNVVNSGSVFGYHQGDFDYNGEINGDDYFIIDSNITFAQANPPFQTGSGGSGGGLAAVPEPASLSLLTVAGASLLRRRRR